MATDIDILYDHYKVSNSMLQSTHKDREKFFRLLFIFEVVNIIFLRQPLEFAKIILIRYFQTNIQIERQYSYIGKLESELTNKAGANIFCRESTEYSRGYPFILNVIDIFYKFIIPLVLLFLHLIKIYFCLAGIPQGFGVVSFIEIIIDTFLIFLIIPYIFYLMKNYN